MDPINPVAGNPEALNQTPAPQSPKIKNPLVLVLSFLLIVNLAITGLFYFQIQKLSKEISKYQSAIVTPPPSASPAGSEGKVFCLTKRPEICTLECVQNPPYICGSDGKSYCTVCQACSNKAVTWYEMRASPCEEQ